ncbi:MAG TPA: FAD-binding protein [Longimicrobiales bacterium]
MTTLAPDRIEDVVAAVRGHLRVAPHGARTKRPLVPDDADAVRLDLTSLAGVVEYDPGEYTFTALAGTRLAEIEALLAGNGQYLPFDPPFAAAGATLGGTVAAGLNGSGRLRYGGIRDFIIGVRLVDGTGRLVRGGGKVVKNAAGFDLPKLMIGSMGRLGVMVELSFKVFPAPPAWRTLRVTCADIGDAAALVARLGRLPLDIEALDIEPPDTVVLRVSGDDASVDAHAARVGTATGRPYTVETGEAEARYWREQRAFDWAPSDGRLVKVPISLRRLVELERTLAALDVPRRYGVAANVAWIAWPADRPLAELELRGLNGLVVRGPEPDGASPWVGPAATGAAVFAERVKAALDPHGRLPALV